MSRRIDAPQTESLLTLVIPCFNERRRLPQTLRRLAVVLDGWQIDYRVLVVDDGSRDGTAETLSEFGSRFSVERLPANRGKGAAVRAGMLAASGRIVAFTDADLPYDMSALRTAVDKIAAGDADVIFGNRLLADTGRHTPRPFMRRIASYVFRGLVRRLTSCAVGDTQCGLKVFRRDAARDVFSRTRIDGFAFDVEVIALVERLGLRWSEIPVQLVNEQETTVSLRRHGPAMLRDLLRMAMQDRRSAPVPAASREVAAMSADATSTAAEGSTSAAAELSPAPGRGMA